jgi:hypothetical protein
MTDEDYQDAIDKEFMLALDHHDNGLANWARRLWDGGMPMDDIVTNLRRAVRIAEVTRRPKDARP